MMEQLLHNKPLHNDVTKRLADNCNCCLRFLFQSDSNISWNPRSLYGPSRLCRAWHQDHYMLAAHIELSLVKHLDMHIVYEQLRNFARFVCVYVLMCKNV